MGKYFTKILHQNFISYPPNLWGGGLNVLISFLLLQALEVDLDESVSQMPKCNINVFFFSYSKKEKKKKRVRMSTADLVHHHNYLSGILFLVNEVG